MQALPLGTLLTSWPAVSGASGLPGKQEEFWADKWSPGAGVQFKAERWVLRAHGRQGLGAGS